MKFCNTFEIIKGDIVCIVGAGGKTSLMKHLADELTQAGCRVLITTTTRLGADQIDEHFNFLVNINGEKAEAPALSEILTASKKYDVTLIEADGAACKNLKGWRENEPVIPEFATKTIGVIDISTIGKKPDAHRPELFEKLTEYAPVVTAETLAKIINSSEGIFKNSSHTENTVYLSKCETGNDQSNTFELASLTDKKLTYGSVQKGKIEKIPKLDAVIMAAGSSSRMGENKLLLHIRNKPIISHLINNINHKIFDKAVLVYSSDEVAEQIDTKEINTIKTDTGQQKHITVKLGTEACSDSDGIMFLVADQPFLTKETIKRLAKLFYEYPGKIIIPKCKGKQRNPVIFPSKVYNELMGINGDRGGRDVIDNHPELTLYAEFNDESEFVDIDTRQDYEKYI